MIKVDVWGGDLHQNHVGSEKFTNWEKAAQFMKDKIETGLLCNVLHTDFIAPDEWVSETEKKLHVSYIAGDE